MARTAKPKGRRSEQAPEPGPGGGEAPPAGTGQDEPAAREPARDTKAKTQVEATPSHRGEISALASAQAPFLYFDGAPNFGLHNGIVNITLEAIRFSAVDHEIVPDRVIVAHLRMGLTAAQALKSALEKVLLLAAPVPGGQKN